MWYNGEQEFREVKRVNILIVGNGFDLAHGLPTRYTDFLKYCRDYEGKGVPISKDTAIASEFQGIIKDNLWLNYFFQITPNLDEDRTWIDFEREIAGIVNFLGEYSGVTYRFTQNGFKLDFQEKKGNYCNPNMQKFISILDQNGSCLGGNQGYEINITQFNDIADFIEYLYQQLHLFVRAFEIYCYFDVNSMVVANMPIRVKAKEIYEILVNRGNELIDESQKNGSTKSLLRVNTRECLEIRTILREIRQAVFIFDRYWDIDTHILVHQVQRLEDETKADLATQFLLDSAHDIVFSIRRFEQQMGIQAFLECRKFDSVLSFNYTNTFRRNDYGSSKTQYCYIHGKAQEDPQKTNLILGIDDTLSPEEARTNFDWIKFKKYYQRIFFQTGSQYKDWIREADNKPNTHIVGHSLDRTDHDVLREFLMSDGKTYIYYHNEQDHIEKIQRVIEIIGKEELIKRVHSNDWQIKFVDQYGPEGIFKPREA